MTYSMRLLTSYCKQGAEARSDVRATTWYADGRVFDDHDQQHSVVANGHGILSTAVLSLPLTQLLTKETG